MALGFLNRIWHWRGMEGWRAWSSDTSFDTSSPSFRIAAACAASSPTAPIIIIVPGPPAPIPPSMSGYPPTPLSIPPYMPAAAAAAAAAAHVRARTHARKDAYTHEPCGVRMKASILLGG